MTESASRPPTNRGVTIEADPYWCGIQESVSRTLAQASRQSGRKALGPKYWISGPSYVIPASESWTAVGAEAGEGLNDLQTETCAAVHIVRPSLPATDVDRQQLFGLCWRIVQPSGFMALTFNCGLTQSSFDTVAHDLLEACLGRVLTEQIVIYEAPTIAATWVTAVWTRLGPSIIASPAT